MSDALMKIVDNEPGMLIPILMFAIGGIIAIVAIVFGSLKSLVHSREQERTRREIAAYIAEGSMTPEDGHRILTAGQPKGKKESGCCL